MLDFGNGRRLERFGEVVLDRVCPAAETAKVADRSEWPKAAARFQRTRQRDGTDAGRWHFNQDVPECWQIHHGEFRLELRLTPFGHVGVFPEQAANWDWIARRVHAARRRLKILNLFAYTGGSTLAAAAAGAEVVHVDAAKNVVAWARRNAELSGLADHPIRWIAEDARRFVRRELRRGNRYDAVILDPPSYGHGPKGEVWKIERHLLPLLAACGELTAGQRAFLLLSCHSPNFGPAELEACFADAVFGHCQSGLQAKPLFLESTDGRRLSSGCLARWPAITATSGD